LVFDAKADQRDSLHAANMLAGKGAGCIITLGGDGTNRVVAKGACQVPILPVSTGTNNVFPYMIEGTIAGLAAGLIATGKVPCEAGTFTSTRLEVVVDGQAADMAIVDAVVCDDIFIGSRAVWKMEKIRQVFLNRCSPVNIGFSSIGGTQQEITPDDPFGMVIEIGAKGQRLTAPVAPGVFETVTVEDLRLMMPGEAVDLVCTPCVIALDGEREVEVKKKERAAIRLDTKGPVVVAVGRTMRWAMQNSVLAPAHETDPLTVLRRWNN
jgi:predicted polyphosphate/ATP-dependent NAD kinase